MREFSIPAMVDIQPAATLTDVVFERARSAPDAVMLRRREEEGSWLNVTAQQFGHEIRALARGLMAAGIGAGDRVGLMARTGYSWTLIDYAIWAAGAVTVPVYETSSTEQVKWMLLDSGARAVFAESAGHVATIAEIKPDLEDLEHIWEITEVGELTKAGADVTDAEITERMSGRRADDLATIIYTSGTTGRPKGCELTHRNLLSGGRNSERALTELFDVTGASTLLFLPLAHSFARIIEVACIEGGAILEHWPDASTVARGLPEARPKFLLAVPRVFEKVYNTAQQQASGSALKKRIFAAAAQTAIAYSRAQSVPPGAADHGERIATGPAHMASGGAGSPAPKSVSPALRARHALFDRLVYSKLRDAVGGQVQYAISGGAPLGERLGHFFRGVGITVLEGYGLTETSAAAFVNRPNRNKIGTVGQPIPGNSVRIADDGEILIRGPIVFRGYWKNPEATAEALDEDGWLHSGDIGTLDDEGFLTVTGRKKELIVTAGGKNVAPAVLEDRLRAHPLISQCMVVGDKRPFIACLITLDPEALDFWKQEHGKPSSETAADLADDPELLSELQAAVDEANKAVSRAESIRKFRVLSSDFTESSGHLTPSLKVKRAVVSRDYAAEIEALYS